ncbi:MAG: signal recognition particle protein [Deltaproteobacteria bacterium]|nr:MAG: signal recognition particle protein [Deltaproteobacteria bacterium]
MFDVLSTGFRNARLKLQGKAQLNEDNVSEALREVRASLIQADVGIDVIKGFLARVKERTLGSVVAVKGGGMQVTPQDHFINACYEELVELMGPVDTSLDLTGKPSIIMMVGLQGSGKTTTTGKLAKRLLAEGRKPMLVAADIYRPAAVDQLMVLGRKLGLPVFSIKGLDPVKLSKLAVAQARNVGRDVVIIDTAGRLAIDEQLMAELDAIKSTVKPHNILFVVDAMIGQDAVQTARTFDERLSFDGFVLTKLDGDARGGAALSIKAVTGKPVKFLGQGESLDKLEEFRPEGLAQRILGFGDVVGLMHDFEKHVDQASVETDAKKMLSGAFTYEDFVKQLKQVRKLGPMREILSKLPGMGEALRQIPPEALDDRELDRTLAIIHSMTRQERRNPEILSDSRFRRIARGCGRDLADVEALHDRFLQARQMMKGLGGMMGNPAAMQQMQRQMGAMQQGGGMPGFPGMPGMGGFPGMGGDGGGGRPTLSVEEKAARRKKQKQKRKARKKNRK